MNKTDTETRTAIKTIFGARNVYIGLNGEVHVKGMMPNTNQLGWYFFGFIGSNDLSERIFHPDGS